jgi:hypothetical protein
MQGPEPIPHQAWYFIYALVGLLAVLIVGWIVKMQ